MPWGPVYELPHHVPVFGRDPRVLPILGPPDVGVWTRDLGECAWTILTDNAGTGYRD